MAEVLAIGAGLSGAVIARQLAERDVSVLVCDARSHVAGNCHTERDLATGVLVHVYGPHIFHTDDEEVWAYVNKFETFRRYKNTVKTTSNGSVYSLPINLHTINQFFGKTFSPEEARLYVESVADTSIDEPRNLEEQALRYVGRDLYEAFFKQYTIKQWGVDPTSLPASVLKRLPLRFNYNDDYFSHRFQGMPENGYTAMVERILDHPKIEVRLDTYLSRDVVSYFKHTFFSGGIDSWFGGNLGRLGYRTLDFRRFSHEGDFQGCAVMNYPDASVPFTRRTEHKHFAPWETHTGSIIYEEYSRVCGNDDTPYYPIRLVEEKRMLMNYVKLAEAQRGVTFVGRLGTYRYLDMDVTIREALDVAAAYHLARSKDEDFRAFMQSPLS